MNIGTEISDETVKLQIKLKGLHCLSVIIDTSADSDKSDEDLLPT